ncbi:MAG: DciA family protein [Gammaproteobacteria bacterium]
MNAEQLRNIRRFLPAPLASHALHCVINKDKLILYTDSPAWGTQLRFYNKEILAAAASGKGNPAKALQIRILAEKTGLNAVHDAPARKPSMENIALIRNQSQHISDMNLKRALQKLCTTLSK